MIEWAEEIGRRHRAEAEMVDRDARHQRELGVDDRGVSGAQGEMKRTRQARRIEQRMNDQGIRSEARFLDPQRAEYWKFLAFLAGADRQAARVDPVGLAACEAAEKCGALDDRHVLPAWAGVRLEHAHTGKAEIGQIRRRM
jgi:hypothetical protein